MGEKGWGDIDTLRKVGALTRAGALRHVSSRGF